MSIIDKALWIIERNSGRALTLVGIADACGVSRSHLANAFVGSTGWPVMKYLRSRRLTQAAEALARGAPDILTVALDAGYASHEAFTRAFRDAFGMTPEQVRERGGIEGLSLVHPTGLSRRPDAPLEHPRVVEGEAIRAVGLARRHRFDALIEIPRHWQAFMAEIGAIPDRSDSIPVGFVHAADDDASFEYVCAAEVKRFGPRVPAGMTAIEVPPRPYAVFEHHGHVSTLFDTHAAIWSRALPALGRTPADAPVLERHLEHFDPGTGEGGVAVWVPLEAGR
ncbi:MAG: helix-turn-helix domain-containing protein [Lautropia sp.]